MIICCRDDIFVIIFDQLINHLIYKLFTTNNNFAQGDVFKMIVLSDQQSKTQIYSVY